MLSKSFKPVKCKTSLKLAMARIKLLKNKREVQVRQLRRELAQLLEAGQEQTARIRVEHVIREEKIMSAYELVEIYCELIVARLPIIESQKGCPIDLKEAISSVIFASPRCADISELKDVKKQFVAKYGKEFVTSAIELRPECGVNRMMVEKLSAKSPDVDTKIKTLTAIAQEYNIKWDSKAFEELLSKPNADLLNGPSTFLDASKMPMESSDANLSSEPNQRRESSMKLFQNDITSKTTNMDTSHSNNNTNRTSGSSTSQNESRATEIMSGGEATSYSRRENASMGLHSWNMEFKDATSAAQAAAESAERASMAARAAAELASRGNISRQSSASMHVTRDNKSDKSKGSKVEPTNTVHELPTDEEMIRRFQELKRGLQSSRNDEDEQVGSRKETESTSGGYVSPRNRSLDRSPSYSSESSIDDAVSEATLDDIGKESHGHAQPSFFEAEHVEQEIKGKKNEDVGLDQWNTNESYGSHRFTRHDTGNASNWSKKIQADGSHSGEDYDMDTGEGTLESGQKQPTYNDYNDTVFDDYGSDTDDISLFGGQGNSLGPFVSNHREEPCIFPSEVDPFSPQEQRKDGSSQLHFVTERSPIEHLKATEDLVHPSQSDVSFPATFDDSDGFSSESEGELTSSVHKEARKSNSSSYNNRSSTRGSLPERSGDGLKSSSFNGRKEYEEADSTVPSIVGEEHCELERKAVDRIQKTSGSGDMSDNQLLSKNNRTSRKLIDSERGSYKHLSDDELFPAQESTVSAPKEAEAGRVGLLQSPPSDGNDTEVSYGIDSEGAQGLSLGRLTGGFKNKGFQRPPYVKSPLVNASVPPEHASTDTTRVPTGSLLDKSSTRFENQDHVSYDKDAMVEDHTPNSRNSSPYIESEAQGPVSSNAYGRRGYRGDDSLSLDETAVVTPSTKEETSYRLAPELHNKRHPRKDYEDISSESEQLRHSAGTRRPKGNASVPPKHSVSISDSSHQFASPEGPKVEPFSQRQQTKNYKELRSKNPETYFDSDDDAEELETKTSTAVKFSRRTRAPPSDSKRDSHLKFISRHDVPADSTNESKTAGVRSSSESQHSSSRTHAISSEGTESTKFMQPTISTEEPSSAPSIQQSSCLNDSSKSSKHSSTQSTNSASPATPSSGEGSTSRESSLKRGSHVHPKLPDYDSLAAHFQSLRANRR